MVPLPSLLESEVRCPDREGSYPDPDHLPSNVRPSKLQLAWIESKMATPMRVDQHSMGQPVDYKLDTPGLGVFFIVRSTNDCHNSSGREFLREVYRMFPSSLRPDTAGQILSAELRNAGAIRGWKGRIRK